MSQPPQPPEPPAGEPPSDRVPADQVPPQGPPPAPEGPPPAQPPVGFGKQQDPPGARPGAFGAPQDPPPGAFGAPQTPPPGGFGAPQTPPPGGYGAPQTPTPGYGAPQGPPPGGFGAPHAAPPAGGYGAPPQQSAPGYGYPGGPPGQPPQAPPPGYGYPGAPGQQPAPGYGYPGPQGQQPGGYPGQQQPYAQYSAPTVAMPPQQPGGGPSRSRNPIALIIGAAVLVIALIVGGGIVYSSMGEDDDSKNSSADGGKGGQDTKDKDGGDTAGGNGTGGTSGGAVPQDTTPREKAPANTKAKPLFQVPSPVIKDDSTTQVAGSWLTDKVYAKAGIGVVGGYDPATGGELWTAKLTGPVCAASRHVTADNRTALVAQPAMPTKAKPYQGCTQVSMLDLTTGKLLWTKTAKSGDRLVSFDEVTIGGGTVAAGGSAGGAAWSAADGSSLWEPKLGEPCYDAGYAGGGALVAVRRCGDLDNRRLEIQNLDPKTGKPLSTYKMATGVDYASVVSTTPLVVAADIGDSAGDGSGISDFFAIDEKTGKLRSKFTAEGDKYAARCDATRVEQCKLLAVGGDRLYLPTEEHPGTAEFSDTNEIVAFDLATGKLLGARADAGDGYTISPIRMDGTNVIAYKRPPYDKGGQVVSLDGATLKATVLMETPTTESSRDMETAFMPEYSEYDYADGRLFMSEIYASKALSDGDKEYLAVAFGTG